MKAKGLICMAMVFGLLVSSPGYSNSQPKQEARPSAQELKFFSGSPAAGGVWYFISVCITQIFERSIPNLATSLVPGGGGGGPIVIGGGKAEAGLVNLGPLLDSQEGLPPFPKKYDNLRLLGNLHNHVLQIIVLKDSGINKIPDLKGKVISTGVQGQYADVWFKRLIGIYNIAPKEINIVHLGHSDAAEQMKDKRIDCLVTGGTLMMPGVEDLATARDIRFLNIDDAQLKKFCKEVNGFEPAVLPGNTLLKSKTGFPDLVTGVNPLCVIVRADLPEELVYKMTKALVENLKELEELTPPMRGFEPKSIARQISPEAKFHAGAERFYKEKGWR